MSITRSIVVGVLAFAATTSLLVANSMMFAAVAG